MNRHVVAVDLQAVFADPASPWAVPRFDAIVEPVRRLVAAAPGPAAVTFTRFVAPATPTGAWGDYYARWPFALTPADHPQYALVPAFADRADAALARPAFGKWGPELAARAGDAAELVVCGVATDCCVLSTVLAAADAGRLVLVAADACAGASDADHDRALEAMALYAPLVAVTTTDALLAAT